jgi:hypothetical protein
MPKINELPAASSVNGTDKIIVQQGTGHNSTKRATVAQLLEGASGGGIESNDPPVNAVAASGIVYLVDNPPVHGTEPGTAAFGTIEVIGQPVLSPAETLTIGIGMWEFVAERATPYQISIDASSPFDAENQATLIKAALDIDLDAGAITAEVAGAIVTVTCVIAGTAGNATVLLQDASSLSLSGDGTFEGGLDKDDYTITIGTQEFIFVAARAIAGEITIGATELETAENMATAFETDVTDVTAQCAGYSSLASLWAVLLTATIKGSSGDDIIIETNDIAEDYLEVLFPTLFGGVDGTVGVANEIRQQGDYIYVCADVNTIYGANWKQYTSQRKKVIEITLGAVDTQLTGAEVGYWVVPDEYSAWSLTRVAATLVEGNSADADMSLTVTIDGSDVMLNDIVIQQGQSSSREATYQPQPAFYSSTMMLTGAVLEVNIFDVPNYPARGMLIVEIVIEEPIGGSQQGG